MEVTIATMMRDMAERIAWFSEQVAWLRNDHDVHVIVVEGDSTDGTYELLEAWAGPDDLIIKCDTGGRRWPSVDSADRWAQLAKVGNVALDAYEQHGPLIWVESDLVWDPYTMNRLLGHLDKVDAVAPMCRKNGAFYDIWGHRGLDGRRFDHRSPEHPDLAGAHGLVEISSAGSCIVMRPEVAAARFQPEDCIVGFCRDLRERGYRLWVDPTVEVMHP